MAEEKKRGSKNSYKMQYAVIGVASARKLFYRLYRNQQVETDQFIPVLESETSTYNETTREYFFKPFEVFASSLNRDNSDKPIKIDLFQFQFSGKHNLIGSAKFIISDINNKRPVPILNKGTEIAKLIPKAYELVTRYSFLDYIFSRLEIALVVGVDFTSSNRDPSNPNSLHYINFRLILIRN